MSIHMYVCIDTLLFFYDRQISIWWDFFITIFLQGNTFLPVTFLEEHILYTPCKGDLTFPDRIALQPFNLEDVGEIICVYIDKLINRGRVCDWEVEGRGSRLQTWLLPTTNQIDSFVLCDPNGVLYSERQQKCIFAHLEFHQR